MGCLHCGRFMLQGGRKMFCAGRPVLGGCKGQGGKLDDGKEFNNLATLSFQLSGVV